MCILKLALENGRITFPVKFPKGCAWILIKDTKFKDEMYYVDVCSKDQVFDNLKTFCTEKEMCISIGNFRISSQGVWRVPTIVQKYIDFDEALFVCYDDNSMRIHTQAHMNAENEVMVQTVEKFIRRSKNEIMKKIKSWSES